MNESLRDRATNGLLRFTYFAPAPCYASTFGRAGHHGWGRKSQKKIRREKRQMGGKR